MLLTRETIFNLLKERHQNPRYAIGTNTMIETDNAGVFYVLGYNGEGNQNGEAWWNITDDRWRLLKQHRHYATIFVNTRKNEMFMILDSDDRFSKMFEWKKSPYKISTYQVKDCLISYENFDEYLRSLED